MHPNTFYSFTPQNLVNKKATTKTRREIIQDLLQMTLGVKTNKSGL